MFRISSSECKRCIYQLSQSKNLTENFLSNKKYLMTSQTIRHHNFRPKSTSENFNIYFKSNSILLPTSSHIDVRHNSEESFFRKKLKDFGFLNTTKSRTELKIAGFDLYAKLSLQIDNDNFFKVLKLPDTFSSYFNVLLLHVWMVSVRLMSEGEDGKHVRFSLVDAMWTDVEERIKRLSDISASQRKEQLNLLIGQFQSALFSYDEGLMSDDTVLASALWRCLFETNCDDPECLEAAIKYVRHQISELDKLDSKQILDRSDVKLTPLLIRTSFKEEIKIL